MASYMEVLHTLSAATTCYPGLDVHSLTSGGHDMPLNHNSGLKSTANSPSTMCQLQQPSLYASEQQTHLQLDLEAFLAALKLHTHGPGNSTCMVLREVRLI